MGICFFRKFSSFLTVSLFGRTISRMTFKQIPAETDGSQGSGAGNICNSLIIKIAYVDGAKAFSLVGLRRARLSLSRNESVDVLRKKIDQIDAKVVNLLNDRASLAQRIGHTKSLSSQEVYAPHREKEILQRVRDLNRGPLSAQAIARGFSGNHFRLPLAGRAVARGFLRRRGDLYPSGRAREIRFRQPTCDRRPASRKSFRKSARAERHSAWCRSRTRPKAWSRILSIYWSIPTCKFARKCIWTFITILLSRSGKDG